MAHMSVSRFQHHVFQWFLKGTPSLLSPSHILKELELTRAYTALFGNLFLFPTGHVARTGFKGGVACEFSVDAMGNCGVGGVDDEEVQLRGCCKSADGELDKWKAQALSERPGEQGERLVSSFPSDSSACKKLPQN